MAGGGADATDAASPIYHDVYVCDPNSDAWLTGPTLPVYVREATGVVPGNEFLVIGGRASSNGTTGSCSNAIYALEVIPEPPDYALLGLGLALLGIRPAHWRWRRKLA